MTDDPDRKSTEADEALEREIRSKRTFSLNDAIGRLSGGDFMKGGTPVSRQRQAELEVEEYLRRHLPDSEGVLKNVVLRDLGESLLASDYDQPLVTLAEYTRTLLASEQLLEDVVRNADIEWGRVQGERPYFQKPGRPADPDDPYTVDSIRAALVRLLDTLAPTS